MSFSFIRLFARFPKEDPMSLLVGWFQRVFGVPLSMPEYGSYPPPDWPPK